MPAVVGIWLHSLPVVPSMRDPEAWGRCVGSEPFLVGKLTFVTSHGLNRRHSLGAQRARTKTRVATTVFCSSSFSVRHVAICLQVRHGHDHAKQWSVTLRGLSADQHSKHVTKLKSRIPRYSTWGTFVHVVVNTPLRGCFVQLAANMPPNQPPFGQKVEGRKLSGGYKP